MAHFNFVISQNAKWGHAGFYIDCHQITVPENIFLQKKHCSEHISTCARMFLIKETAVSDFPVPGGPCSRHIFELA